MLVYLDLSSNPDLPLCLHWAIHIKRCDGPVQTQAMPLPMASLRAAAEGFSEDEALSAALAASLAQEGAQDGAASDGGAKEPPQGGVSFAKITALGYAATGLTPYSHYVGPFRPSPMSEIRADLLVWHYPKSTSCLVWDRLI